MENRSPKTGSLAGFTALRSTHGRCASVTTAQRVTKPPTSKRLSSVICRPGQPKRDSVTNRMDIHESQFSKRDSGKFVTDAKTVEAIANIGLSRCHASNPRPRTICEKSRPGALASDGQTPAQAAGTTDHAWTIEELLGFKP